MLRNFTRTNPRRFPGVTCCRSSTRNRSGPILISMPFFILVACMEAICRCPEPFDVSTTRTCYDRPMTWDPMRDLRAWQERLASPRAEAWTPPIDVYETADRYVVAVEVPGMTREQ